MWMERAEEQGGQSRPVSWVQLILGWTTPANALLSARCPVLFRTVLVKARLLN